MKKSKTDKNRLVKLFMGIADYESRSAAKAKSFLEEQGFNSDKLLAKVMKKIQSEKEENDFSAVFPYSALVKKLTMSGIDNNLIKKILPCEVSAQIHNAGGILDGKRFNEVFQYLERIFKISISDLYEEAEIRFKSRAFDTALFKTASNPNINQIKAYSHYAFYLAEIVNGIFDKKPKYQYPGDLEEFSIHFYKTYKQLTFKNLLNYAWDMGIAVIPLDDSGIFHGASWNIDDHHVIVLKQKSRSHARWMFDLLHELYHVFAHLDKTNSSVLETDEVNPFRENSSFEEMEANTFSSRFIFEGKAELLAKEILELSGNDMRLFKKSLTAISESNDVPADFLANYLAFRLQCHNLNWWQTAESFQIRDPEPFRIASDVLQDRIDINGLESIDRNLLMNAIEY